jgi:hypothetical protein
VKDPKALPALQVPKAPPARKGPLVRKVLQDHQDQPVRKEVPVSKGLQAHRV